MSTFSFIYFMILFLPSATNMLLPTSSWHSLLPRLWKVKKGKEKWISLHFLGKILPALGAEKAVRNIWSAKDKCSECQSSDMKTWKQNQGAILCKEWSAGDISFCHLWIPGGSSRRFCPDQSSRSVHTLPGRGLAQQVSSSLQETSCPSHPSISNCCTESFVSSCTSPRTCSSNLSLRRSPNPAPAICSWLVWWGRSCFNWEWREGLESPRFCLWDEPGDVTVFAAQVP